MQGKLAKRPNVVVAVELSYLIEPKPEYMFLTSKPVDPSVSIHEFESIASTGTQNGADYISEGCSRGALRESPETERKRLPRDAYEEWLRSQIRKYNIAERAEKDGGRRDQTRKGKRATKQTKNTRRK